MIEFLIWEIISVCFNSGGLKGVIVPVIMTYRLNITANIIVKLKADGIAVIFDCNDFISFNDKNKSTKEPAMLYQRNRRLDYGRTITYNEHTTNMS